MNWTGFRIWIFSVLLNGLFVGVWVGFTDEPILSLPVSFLAALVGIFITAPLLVIVMLLVDLAAKLGYTANARIFWLFIMLTLVGCSYIFLLGLMILKNFWRNENDMGYAMMLSISLAIGMAVFSERNSLRRRYETVKDTQQENQEPVDRSKISNMQ